jgi:aspartyl-tRNA(Asn)/glutamyl-tRNA(Gln) amidotransferase subunit A
MFSLHDLTIAEANDRIRRRELTSAELTEAALARIREHDPSLHAFLHVAADRARELADRADRAVRRGEPVTPVTGVPFAVKDCLSTRGVPTTCASRILEGYVAPFDATVVSRLLDAGAVLLGKNNMDEFGMGSSCENSAYGPARNPWRRDRVPGGSSGGSAAAVAARLVPFALGEDTGGSIRVPAAFCGTVGLKPTYGRVSRYGLVALASSLDSVGPITRTVGDCARVFQVIAGHDARDATSAALPVPTNLIGDVGDLRGTVLGVPREYFVEGIDPAVEQALREAIRHFTALGAASVDVSLPHTRYAIATYYPVQCAEASANLARFDGVRFGPSPRLAGSDALSDVEAARSVGFGPEAKRRIMIGTFVLSAGCYDAYYGRAQKVRTLIRRDFDEAFARCDALVTPVCPTTAFRIGEKMADPLAMYHSDIFVTAVNLAGLPALVLPCGMAQGLPVGLQLIGKPFAEDALFRLGHAYQMSTEWHINGPSGFTSPVAPSWSRNPGAP